MQHPDVFSLLVAEYKEKYLQKEKSYDKTLLGEVKRVKDALLDEKFKPSVQLKNILNKQMKRAVYPMEVAIVGQFSSGKSTFLNALLSKGILSTGITPVTSKVIYINYGETYRLRVTYRSGAHAYYPLENISLFSDQRIKQRDDIKYLTVYAPVEILKEISFVDTPGLNSQSQEDTQNTQKVFQDVGGIIWLTLMDNAGKRSEQEILNTYMSAFKTKSLCLLNQKDKFSQAQILSTTAYVEKKFSNYFSKVIPISAQMALDARSLEPTVLTDDAMSRLIQDFRSGLENNPQCTTLKFFNEDFERFKKEVGQINSLDISSIEEKVTASNINDVLAYIDEEMRPNAEVSKAFKIKNDLINICDILMNAYHTMLSVYDALKKILESAKQKSTGKLEEIDVCYAHDLVAIHSELEMIFTEISREIYSHISLESVSDFKTSISSFLQQEKIEKYSYETFKIDHNSVMERLFYNDGSVENMLKRVTKRLNDFETHVTASFSDIYNTVESDVISWQTKYLLLSKNREISSDLEFSKVKRFASKVHENILKTFHMDILGHIERLNKKSAYLQGAISYNFTQTVQVSMFEIGEKIFASESLYKKDPVKFSIYKPSEEDILQRLKMNFDFEKLDDLLNSQNSYLHRSIKEAKGTFLDISEQKIAFIEKEKIPFVEKIEALAFIKSMIDPEDLSL